VAHGAELDVARAAFGGSGIHSRTMATDKCKSKSQPFARPHPEERA